MFRICELFKYFALPRYKKTFSTRNSYGVYFSFILSVAHEMGLVCEAKMRNKLVRNGCAPIDYIIQRDILEEHVTLYNTTTKVNDIRNTSII